MVLDFPRSDRIAMREAMEQQARQSREQESRLAARMRRAAERRDTLEDLRRTVTDLQDGIERVRSMVERNLDGLRDAVSRSNSIPDEVA